MFPFIRSDEINVHPQCLHRPCSTVRVIHHVFCQSGCHESALVSVVFHFVRQLSCHRPCRFFGCTHALGASSHTQPILGAEYRTYPVGSAPLSGSLLSPQPQRDHHLGLSERTHPDPWSFLPHSPGLPASRFHPSRCQAPQATHCQWIASPVVWWRRFAERLIHFCLRDVRSDLVSLARASVSCSFFDFAPVTRTAHCLAKAPVACQRLWVTAGSGTLSLDIPQCWLSKWLARRIACLITVYHCRYPSHSSVCRWALFSNWLVQVDTWSLEAHMLRARCRTRDPRYFPPHSTWPTSIDSTRVSHALMIEKDLFFWRGSGGLSGMSQRVSRCGEKNKAEAAGKHNQKGAPPGALSLRQQQGGPEQIDGSREVKKKGCLANSRHQCSASCTKWGAAIMWISYDVRSLSLGEASRLRFRPANLRRSYCS